MLVESCERAYGSETVAGETLSQNDQLNLLVEGGTRHFLANCRQSPASSRHCVHITYVAQLLGASVAGPFHRLTTMESLNLYKAILDAGPSFGRLERIDYPMYVCLPPTRSISPSFQTLVRTTSSTIHPYLPLPNNLRQLYPSARDSTQLLGLLAQACSELENVSCMAATSQSGLEVVEISAKCNTWSRAARRRQKAGGVVDSPVTIDNNVAMVCFVHCARTGAGEFYLEASWAKGKDRSLFETFWSHTSRKIGTGLEVAAV